MKQIYLLFLFIVALPIVYGACTVSMAENCTIDNALQLTPNTVYVAERGFDFNTAGASLDCNGSTIFGYGQKYPNIAGLRTNFNNNIVIKNCVVANFSRGIVVSGSSNITIKNSKIFNTTGTMALFLYNSNYTLTDNVTINVTLGAQGDGIQLGRADLNYSLGYHTITNSALYNIKGEGIYSSWNGHTNISHNIIQNTSNHSVRLSSSSNDEVSFNTIRLGALDGVASNFECDTQNCSNIVVHHNNITDTALATDGNCANFHGTNGTYFSNYIANCAHVGLNLVSKNYGFYTLNNTVRDNTIVNASTYIQVSKDLKFYNNILTVTTPNDDGQLRCLAVEGNITENINNSYYNNTINCVNGVALFIGTSNDIFENNTINAGNTTITLANWYDNNRQVNNARLYGNTYGSSINVTIRNDNTGAYNYSLNSTTPPLFAKIPQETADGAIFNIRFNYTGLKQYRLTGENITMWLSYPNNDIFNSSGLIASNQINYTMTLKSGSEFYVGAYSNLTYRVNIPPSPNTSQVYDAGASVQINSSVTDPDNIVNMTYHTLYNYYGVAVFSANSSEKSLVSTLADLDGTYSYSVILYLTTGDIIRSDPITFIVGTGTTPTPAATGQCNTSETSLWGLLLLMFIVGLLYTAYKGFIEGSAVAMISFVVILTVATLIVSSSIDLLRGLC